jgi:group I intron endonuclease
MKIYTIYRATNTDSGKVYIGFTSHWPQRINGHNYDRRYGNTNKAFYNAITKYGWDAFEWEAIYQSQDYEHTLKIMEPYFINEHRSWVGFEDCNGYNITQGGEGTTGWKRSTELVESHRAQLKGRKQTPEHIQKRREVMTGRSNKSALGENNPAKRLEVREKISHALKGKPKSESHKQAMKLRPQNTLNLTCPHCSKTGDYKNMNRWHMDQCKHNPDKLATIDKIVKCITCGHESKESPNFYRYHNDNCRKKD